MTDTEYDQLNSILRHVEAAARELGRRPDLRVRLRIASTSFCRIEPAEVPAEHSATVETTRRILNRIGSDELVSAEEEDLAAGSIFYLLDVLHGGLLANERERRRRRARRRVRVAQEGEPHAPIN
jgi:hypothetical protein